MRSEFKVSTNGYIYVPKYYVGKCIIIEADGAYATETKQKLVLYRSGGNGGVCYMGTEYIGQTFKFVRVLE